MNKRTIKKIVSAVKVNMGGIFLDQAIPVRGIDQIDPFLLIHHWSDTLKGGKKQSQLGVGPHPHRGFVPVTFIFKGGVHHRDSTGMSEVVYGGGTQWMHSGTGIVHSERPAKELAENGGDFELIQFWVNVPSSKKLVDPKYVPLTAEQTPFVESKDKKIKIGIITGEYQKKKGGITPESEMLLLRLDCQQNGTTELSIPANYNCLIYLLDGNLTINGSEAKQKDMVWFENDSETIEIKANANTRAIVLSGKPLNEPVATYGPFVMNTDEEIVQALHDYQNGKMGHLIEKFN